MRKRAMSALAAAFFGLLILVVAPWKTFAGVPPVAHYGSSAGGFANAAASPIKVGRVDGATPSATSTPGCELAWRDVASTNTGTMDNWLNGVSALSANNAWAVGYTNISTGGDKATLVEHWNGAAWEEVPSPNYGSEVVNNVLKSVYAVAPNDVWAVGYFYGPIVIPHTLVQHWDGRRWTMVPSPDGDERANYLNDVWAVAPNDVWAVGYSRSMGNNDLHTLALHWNGSRWDVVPTPNITSRTNVLNAVTGAASNDVWATGYFYNEESGHLDTLVQHWDGTQWSIVPSPNSGVSNVLYDAFALASNDVWAAGDWEDDFGSAHTMLEHWDGSTWSIVPSPDVSAFANNLYGLAGISAKDVWAAGSSFNGDGTETLVQHWDGTQWSVVPSPSRGALGNEFMGISAASAQDVWAVGDTLNDGHEGTKTLTERYSSSCATPVPTSTPLVTPTACSVSYSDVPANSPFYPYITCLSCRGIINGYGDNTFRPNKNVTRGQVTKMVVLAGGWPIDTSGGPHFSDVQAGDTYYAFVETAYNHSIISGYADGTFRPGSDVTRAQLAKIVSLAAGFGGIPGFQLFHDVPPDHPFYQYAQMLGARTIMDGYRCSDIEPCIPPYPRHYFRPNNSATRGQVAKIIANTFYPECNPAVW